MVRRSGRNGKEAHNRDLVVHEEEDGERARSLSTHVRARQRAVAQREAARLARPEQRKVKTLGHADRKKSAVSSTPFGKFRAGGNGNHSTEADEVWCGPFSVAREMIAKREEERRKKETEVENEINADPSHPLDYLIDQVALERKRKAHPSLLWKSRSSSSTGDHGTGFAKRTKRMIEMRSIPSLFDLCVNFLVTNFEYVECLGYVDNEIRSTIAKELVSRNKLDEAAFKAIAEPGIEALELVDCSAVSQDQLSETLQKILPTGLRYLALDQAGRCFGPQTVNTILSSKSDLFALSIGGAYLLKDNDAAKIIDTFASTLSSIKFKACPMLSNMFCESIGDSFSSRGALLELSLEDLDISNENLSAIANTRAFHNIRSLSLRRIGGLNDKAVNNLLEIAGDTLEALDLSNNYDLTDLCLSPIRKFNPVLRSLHLSNLKNLTAPGLEALFTPKLDDLGPPPMLKSFNLASCHYEVVTDDVLKLALQAACRRRADTISGVETNRNLSYFGGIVNLNIQGSHATTDTTMENLVAYAATSLQELNISFCPQISNQGLGYLVDKMSHQLKKIEIWGCAQVTSEFLDGHNRVQDSTIEIEGAWMKKGSN